VMKHLAVYLILFLCLKSGAVVNAQNQVLSPEQMHQLVPHYIKGFQRSQELKGKLVKVGDLQYSVCEQSFTQANQQIRVLMFDFGHARIMYKQATKEWHNFSPILTDTITLQAIRMTNCSGWQSYKKNNNTSEIYLGICDRFFLTLTGEFVPLETLKSFLEDFHFDQFPK
jgi:hypothetical protein